MERRWRNLEYLQGLIQILCFCGHHSQKIQFWNQIRTSVCINMGCNCGVLEWTSPAFGTAQPFSLSYGNRAWPSWPKWWMYDPSQGKQSPLMGFFLKWDLEERSSIFLTSESCGQCVKWIIGEWDQQKEPWERGKKKSSGSPSISVAGSTQFFPWFDNWVDRFQLC